MLQLDIQNFNVNCLLQRPLQVALNQFVRFGIKMCIYLHLLLPLCLCSSLPAVLAERKGEKKIFISDSYTN